MKERLERVRGWAFGPNEKNLKKDFKWLIAELEKAQAENKRLGLLLDHVISQGHDYLPVGCNECRKIENILRGEAQAALEEKDEGGEQCPS